jgi:hypothetical protein
MDQDWDAFVKVYTAVDLTVRGVPKGFAGQA